MILVILSIPIVTFPVTGNRTLMIVNCSFQDHIYEVKAKEAAEKFTNKTKIYALRVLAWIITMLVISRCRLVVDHTLYRLVDLNRCILQNKPYTCILVATAIYYTCMCTEFCKLS